MDHVAPPVIGLIGGVGSGKSAVAQRAARLCAGQVINADALGHTLLEQEPIRVALRRQFGEVFDSHGAVDRRRLAHLVFGPGPEHAQRRRLLEQLTHPPIRALIEAQIAAARDDEVLVIFLDAALLLETGWQALCDKIVFVDASEATRRDRILARGWTEDAWRLREASQLPLDHKRAAAHLLLPNEGDLDGAARTLLTELDLPISPRDAPASHPVPVPG